MALNQHIFFIYSLFLFIYIKQNDGKRVCFFDIQSNLSLFFCYYRARVIPENILKKQARDAKMLKQLKDSRVQAKVDRAAARKVAAANAEKYHNEYQLADSNLVKAKRDAKAAGSFYVEQAPKVAIVVRIRG